MKTEEKGAAATQRRNRKKKAKREETDLEHPDRKKKKKQLPSSAESGVFHRTTTVGNAFCAALQVSGKDCLSPLFFFLYWRRFPSFSFRCCCNSTEHNIKEEWCGRAKQQISAGEMKRRSTSNNKKDLSDTTTKNSRYPLDPQY
jgi:hypothetical protein